MLIPVPDAVRTTEELHIAEKAVTISVTTEPEVQAAGADRNQISIFRNPKN